jgi:hypothetical protein
MHVPQNFFQEYHAKRLLKWGIRTKFAEYVEYKDAQRAIRYRRVRQLLNSTNPIRQFCSEVLTRILKH